MDSSEKFKFKASLIDHNRKVAKYEIDLLVYIPSTSDNSKSLELYHLSTDDAFSCSMSLRSDSLTFVLAAFKEMTSETHVLLEIHDQTCWLKFGDGCDPYKWELALTSFGPLSDMVEGLLDRLHGAQARDQTTSTRDHVSAMEKMAISKTLEHVLAKTHVPNDVEEKFFKMVAGQISNHATPNGANLEHKEAQKNQANKDVIRAKEELLSRVSELLDQPETTEQTSTSQAVKARTESEISKSSEALPKNVSIATATQKFLQEHPSAVIASEVNDKIQDMTHDTTHDMTQDMILEEAPISYTAQELKQIHEDVLKSPAEAEQLRHRLVSDDKLEELEINKNREAMRIRQRQKPGDTSTFTPSYSNNEKPPLAKPDPTIQARNLAIVSAQLNEWGEATSKNIVRDALKSPEREPQPSVAQYRETPLVKAVEGKPPKPATPQLIEALQKVTKKEPVLPAKIEAKTEVLEPTSGKFDLDEFFDQDYMEEVGDQSDVEGHGKAINVEKENDFYKSGPPQTKKSTNILTVVYSNDGQWGEFEEKWANRAPPRAIAPKVPLEEAEKHVTRDNDGKCGEVEEEWTSPSRQNENTPKTEPKVTKKAYDYEWDDEPMEFWSKTSQKSGSSSRASYPPTPKPSVKSEVEETHDAEWGGEDLEVSQPHRQFEATPKALPRKVNNHVYETKWVSGGHLESTTFSSNTNQYHGPSPDKDLSLRYGERPEGEWGGDDLELSQPQDSPQNLSSRQSTASQRSIQKDRGSYPSSYQGDDERVPTPRLSAADSYDHHAEYGGGQKPATMGFRGGRGGYRSEHNFGYADKMKRIGTLQINDYVPVRENRDGYAARGGRGGGLNAGARGGRDGGGGRYIADSTNSGRVSTRESVSSNQDDGYGQNRTGYDHDQVDEGYTNRSTRRQSSRGAYDNSHAEQSRDQNASEGTRYGNVSGRDGGRSGTRGASFGNRSFATGGNMGSWDQETGASGFSGGSERGFKSAGPPGEWNNGSRGYNSAMEQRDWDQSSARSGHSQASGASSRGGPRGGFSQASGTSGRGGGRPAPSYRAPPVVESEGTWGIEDFKASTSTKKSEF